MFRNFTPLLFWGVFLQILRLTEQNTRHKRNISPDLPRIMTQNGHLVFKSGVNHNISFQAVSGGFINVGNDDLSVIVQSVKDNRQRIEELRTVSTTATPSNLASRLTEVEQRLNSLQPTGQVLSQLTDLTRRITNIESVQQALNNRLNQVEQSLGSSGQIQTSISRLNTRFTSLRNTVDGIVTQDTSQNESIRRLERRVNQLRSLLTADECSSNPCRNGGTCVDRYNGFTCKCPNAWQGITCELDVNECGIYAGTDLGCQNGATCVNSQGGFRCRCTADYHGVLCTERHDDCTGASNEQMCGHGTCVNRQRTQPNMPKYTCICDDGWTKSGSDPSCTVDVDECNERSNACSVDPQVPCINLPGTFSCGQCPAGYVGNGFSCADINECANNNGGCSLVPRVDCINTRGSRSCGPCPSGYQGNGVTCSWVGLCGTNNGGCHPMAVCSENPGFGGRMCTCRQGYVGNGIGASGCVQQGPTTGACASNPCRNGGLCQNSGTSFSCVCNPGFGGLRCDTNVNECSSNPCQNGGTCVDGVNGYNCQCTGTFSGSNCQEQQQSCGGTLTEESGTLIYPSSPGTSYPHGVNCAWEIRGAVGKILMLTFTQFNIEQHSNCNFDYLQIHDGPTASQHRIGKYCGTTLPNGGTINTTTHEAYLWFHSDDSIARDGFTVTWRSVIPVCGGEVTGNNHGMINSPGYPGNYPNNRNCVWRISVDPGNNIVFAFAFLNLESHVNCSHDYLQIRDGSSDDSRLLGTYCNSSILPAPLTTTSPHGYVLFHTDHSVTRKGFSLTYAGVSAGPQCGGTLTDASGSVMSPNYPSPYNHDATCVWVISVHQGDQITLTFAAMDLEHHNDCQYDYVLVRDGSDENADLLGRWCGNEVPAVLTSTGNNLYIEFRSDVSTAGSGFKADYTTGCGGTFTTEEGTIQSPYFPDAYPGNKECIFIISLPAGSRITLTFSSFDVEDSSDCSYDYVEIRDGTSADSAVLNKFCGSQVPDPVTTTQNSMWVKFVSDGSVHNTGFQATYAASSAACGGVLTEDTDSFTSPGHPNTYPHGVNCTWQIRVSPGHVIRLTFNTFSIEDNSGCRFDYVQVFDNATATPGSGLGRKCGSTIPPVLTSSDNVMTVVFASDNSIAHEGFSASYVALNASTLCGNPLTDRTGLITSPNYPSNYPHNRECVWTITANDGNQILLNVTDFELERHDSCTFDFLEIRNGGYQTSPLLGTYCGTTIDPIIRSHSNQMYIKFKSDFSRSAKGFQIYYDSTASGCGADLTTPTGSFVSPNYPAPYSHNAECFWTVTVSRGSTITLVFVDFDLENHHRCTYDYVKVREDGPQGQQLAHYCGSQPPEPVTSNTNKIWIKYRTDNSVSGRGFHATYFSNCNVRLTSWSGVIESPNFPNAYYHNRNCTWTIETTMGNTINASFSHFDIESHSNCLYDYLQIRDGENMEANEIGQYCGSSLPPTIASTDNTLWLNFMSDYSVAGNGFRLEYITNGCGGYLVSTTGSFTSPNYPNPYPHRRECVWMISLPTGNAIELTIVDFDLETHSSCQYDVLEVYEGSDTSGPQLTKICHKQKKPQLLTSSGNIMYVRFASDSSVSGNGFRVTYRGITGGCGGNFSTPTGTLLSKNYPDNYPHNTECEWLITVQEGQTVVLTFEDFDVEGGSCRYDYVAGYDGRNRNSTEIFRHCGTAVPSPNVFTSTGNQMFVRMRTDASVSARGFKATYSTGCGGLLSAEEDGEIVSPNYPNSYRMLSNCTWIIRGLHSNDRVTLTFTHMDLELYNSCNHDYVTVYDGDDVNGTVVGTYCGSTVPASITSQGSAMTVQFTSDASVQKSGFRALYTKSVSSCGANFTAEHGSFTSPGYPNEYPMDTECVWTIYAPPGNNILIAFSFFSLEDHLPTCAMDYLELREGNVHGRLLGRYCGNQAPSNLTAVNGLWIKFRSDDSLTEQGFIAQYSTVYGGTLSGRSGQVASPRYPRAYPNNADYVWTISTDVGTRIRITFMMLDMERYGANDQCTYDYIEFRDGDQADSPVLSSYCGTTLPAPFLTTTNQLRVRFLTDFASFGNGFLFKWEATTDQSISTTVSPTTATVPGCGGDVNLTPSSRQQTITSPGYPNGYAHNLNCIWRITAPEGFKVWANITDISLESHGTCNYDYVMLSQAALQRRETYLGKFCGRVANTQPMVTEMNSLMVTLVTDQSVNYTGFSITVRSVCGGRIYGSSGRIASDNYPNSYPANSDCSWVIIVPTGRTVRAQFNGTFNIAGSGSGCQGDYIQLLTGSNENAPPMGNAAQGKYCGTSPPQPLETTSHFMYVKFISDGSNNAAGFSMVFNEVQVTCGGHLTLSNSVTSGYFTSPNYPSNYTHNVECVWIITAPANERIQIDFDERFRIENHMSCRFDFIELRDGGTTNSPSLGKFCGITRPGTVKSTGNVMYARFRTDGSAFFTGFKANYKIATCGGTIRGQSGYIQSPNFPSPYDSNMDCEWYIHAPTGHYMTFNFLSFNLQYGSNCTVVDYVEIREHNSTGPLLKRACGSSTPASVDTSDSFAYVRFKSNSASNQPGFKLAFHASVEECGGYLTTPIGSFSSPNFPGRYPHSRTCEWKIRVPHGRRVTLNFDSFNIEASRTCYDYVDVYNGILDDSPLFRRVCGETNPGIIQSYGNTMKVIFRTDGSISNGGFRASYSSQEDTVCGGILSNTNGNITSIGYPNANYSNNEECIWVIQNPNINGSTIMLNFMDFSLESHGDCTYDFIEVREGTDENGELVGKFCGNTTLPLPVFSPMPNLWVRYKSDHSNVDKGFLIKYTFTDCGGILAAPSGVITSPNFPNVYNNSDACAWLIQQPEGYQVNVHFGNFSLESHPECRFDYVQILNGRLPSSPSVGQFCGNHTITDFVSQSNALRVIFNSDYSIGGNGFMMSYFQSSGGCGGLLHQNTGRITSPNYPQSYPHLSECEWDINVERGYHIILNFIPPFDLEAEPSCDYDYVEVDDSLPNNTLVPRGRWCHNLTPPKQMSSSNRIVVRFRSDRNTNGNGFAANWTVGCGAVFMDDNGVFVSPGYPNNYGPNLVCNYTIVSNPGRFIVLQFNRIFDIEGPASCPYDALTVYEGNSTAGTELGKFCGTTVPQAVSGKDALFIQFKTDGTVPGKGFWASYRVSDCGGEFTDPFGYIQTPTHPTSYHHNANCTWLITVEENRIVSLKFNSFELEAHQTCNFDYVDVYDGGDLSSPMIGRFCGEVVPDVLRTTGNQMLINFVTDWSVSLAGFTATYRTTYGESQGCGGVLNSTSGRITSVDSDGNGKYEHNLDCRWIIIVGDNKIVKLTVEGLGVESHSTCYYDFLEIRDGFYMDDPLKGKYCGDTVPPIIRSTSNVLLVRFYTDSSVDGAGFNATYVQEDALCGGTRTATDSPQTLTSPGYPGSVFQPIQCRWTIDTPESNQQVRLTMTGLALMTQTSCTDEYVEFRDSPMGTMGQSVHFCGSTMPGPFDSIGTTVQVNLAMMGMASSNGFSLKYQIASCNRTYNGNSGQIYSPGWPGNYPVDSYCEMTVTSSPGTSLSLYFNSFQIEAHRSCQYDGLLIRNSSSGTDIATLCGMALPDPIFAQGNRLWMKFYTDISVTHPGYSISYTASFNGIGCGGNITGVNGSLTSPGFPSNNTLRQTCGWLLSAPARRTITVRFTSINVFGTAQCDTNYVEVYNGGSESNLKFSRYCSSETIAPLHADTNQVYVKYVSSGSGSAPLFRLVYTS
ncbi:cubilin-like isoform X2 [Mytilus edulis]|uniref:cubilin-like isoform X2 n=1 Tax=Mytilus edulis TaxID=6550 RepID=UPI0039EF9879